MEYDPLLAKLAVWAARREETTDRMIRALREYDVGGIRTNLGFFRQILEDEEFRAGHLHTGFIEEFFARHSPPHAPRELAAVAALVAALYASSRNERRSAGGGSPAARARGSRPEGASCCDETRHYHRRRTRQHRDSCARPGLSFPPRTAMERAANVETPEPGVYSILMDGRSYEARIEENPRGWRW